MFTLTQLRALDAVARLGSVTRAAEDLHYSQPSVSHHLSRLEAATGAALVQRVGRGIRLTGAGELLARRAAEIIVRLDAASAELGDLVAMRAGRVRLAGFQTALSTIVPAAATSLAASHPGIDLGLAVADPDDALQQLSRGEIDIALIFRHDETPPERDGFRAVALLDDPLYLVSSTVDDSLATHAEDAWIGGCDRCRAAMVEACHRAGFEPRIAYSADDTIVIQALVAAGLAVATQPGLALAAHRAGGVHATKVPGQVRQIMAVTYGEPPDPPPIAAFLEALTMAAQASAARVPD